LSAPWTILGFWNSIIGLALALVSKNPTKLVAPFLSDVDDDAPIRSRVAVAMAVRNEDAERVFARLIAVRQSLDLTGYGAQFDLHILSDTDNSEIAEQEEALFKSHRVALNGLGAARYRRRTDNAGFKAGNVWQFLEDHADGYEMFVPLDADSLMSGGAILKLVRIAEANPRLGIVQSLAVGAPAESAFGRMFQFGMRHGMRAFTLGSAWWQGDCGPFWGHNAVVRCQAFHRNCKLPKLGGRPPLGGEILSHDQLEAVMMRRAGYEVRVVPVESESFEENPVTVLDFIQREQRWCNGNMQYLRLLGMRGLERTSRFQLVQAIMMYLSAPAHDAENGWGAACRATARRRCAIWRNAQLYDRYGNRDIVLNAHGPGCGAASDDLPRWAVPWSQDWLEWPDSRCLWNGMAHRGEGVLAANTHGARAAWDFGGSSTLCGGLEPASAHRFDHSDTDGRSDGVAASWSVAGGAPVMCHP